MTIAGGRCATALSAAIVTVITAVAMLSGPAANAQEKWPSKRVTLVVPVGAGTITDATARLLADYLKSHFGQTFLVENRPGAGATLGSRHVARSPADGYTFLLGGNTTHSVAPSLFKNLGYDPVSDFTPVAHIGKLSSFLATNAQQPFKTIQEMATFAAANPGKLSYGHGNATGNIIGATIKKKLDIDIVGIPYASNPPAIADLINNGIQLMAVDTLNGVPLVEAGKIVALAVGAKARNPKLPSIPTLHETLIADFEVLPWVGLFGPPSLPPDITEQMSAALGKILSDETFVTRLQRMGPEPYYLPSGPFAAFVAADVPIWAEHARIAGIAPQ
jgi:tripartite-type tricarboxylate transporter receptor subunit TctC